MVARAKKNLQYQLIAVKKSYLGGEQTREITSPIPLH